MAMERQRWRSQKPLWVRERLLFALDVSTVGAAKRRIDALSDSVVFYKIGLELFMSGGTSTCSLGRPLEIRKSPQT
jgi:orotidine-5'-phosphate decarboxylase